MIAAWMVYALVIGALLAVAALAAEGVCRLAARPARWVWATALALTVALTLLAPRHATPSAATIVMVPSVTRADATTEARGATFSLPHLLAVAHELRDAMTTPVRRAIATAEHQTPASLDRALTAIWLVLSALLLALCAVVYLRFRRARRSWPVAELHGVRVRVAPEMGPAVVGLARPEIIIPRWLLRRTPEEQHLALAHEREHVRMRDPIVLAAACVAAALIPWHPAVWWMLSRLRLAVELDCDARVLRRGAAPRSYGALLIELAGHGSGLRLAAPALADSASHLQRRILAMKPKRSRFAPARGGALGIFAVLALVVACETQLPTSAEVEKMDVASAEKSAVSARMIASMDSVLYTINGRHASAEQAHALSPDQIASVNVIKAAMDSAAVRRRAEIQITTKKAADADVAEAARADSASVLSARAVEGAPRKSKYSELGTDGVSFTADSTRFPGKKAFAGLLLIDDVQAPNSALQTLAPEKIKSVEVIKGPAALKRYSDPKAANGVILITTIDGSKSK